MVDKKSVELLNVLFHLLFQKIWSISSRNFFFASDWWTATTNFCVITRQLSILFVGGVKIVTKSVFNAQHWATLSAVVYDTTTFLWNSTETYVFRFRSNCLWIVCPNHTISSWAKKQRNLIWEPWFLKLKGHKGTVSNFFTLAQFWFLS